MHALTALALGATGYLSSEGNLAPGLCVSVIDAHASGDLAATASAFGRLLRLFRSTQAAGGIVGTKAALRHLGAAGGWPRPPRLTPADARVTDLLATLDELGLVESEGLAR